MKYRIELKKAEYESVITPGPGQQYINKRLSGWVYTFDTHIGEVFVKIDDAMDIKDAKERITLAARQAVSTIYQTEKESK